MNQHPENYLQEYYENTPQIYEGYHESEFHNCQGNCGDSSSLQVPNTQLYTEDVQGMAEKNPQFCEYPLSMEIPTGSCRQFVSTTFPQEYYNDALQTHQFRPITVKDPVTSKHIKSYSHNVQYVNQYPAYQNEEILYVHPNTSIANTTNIEDTHDDNYNFETYHDNFQHNAQSKACNYHYNLSSGNKISNDIYVETSEKKQYNYGQKISRKAVVKKFPVTVKTPKYVTKNLVHTAINKKPSTLCLPVVTQPDPALVRMKSKTNHHTKKNLGRSEHYSANIIYDQVDNYSAHKMHSQGDVKNSLTPEGLETVLDKYENDMAFSEPDDLYGVGEVNIEQKNCHIFKEFAKYLKPKIPSSVKIKEEHLPSRKTSNPLRPKLKLSLDKLLNRLQKCENGDNIEKSSEGSCRSKLKNKDETNMENKDVNVSKVQSFNYETLTRKCSQSENKDRDSGINSSLKEPLHSVLGSFDSKRSVRIMKPMDDQCALDLHRSKSYIVDLIDRALSKELGTMPRGQSVHHDLTPHKAITTISRSRPQRSSNKELCYEVTAALTDSIISSATAPPKQALNKIIERSTSDQQIKEKMSDDNYIKQLKQLRWGHIRHIQHEARKLADLEEFLEKCGEIEY